MTASTRTVLRSLLCVGLALVATAAFCQGSPSLTKADGLENWDHDFDLSGLPAGTYNIIVQGKDSAGNVQIAGPINVRIDPASALPVVTIINPTRLQRIGGDLIAVGACVAEAGVARVEVSIDGGEYQPAQGGEFWSLSIPTRDISEGKKTLEVRGVDTAGLVGKPVKVVFDLDRTEPAATVVSPQPGALVAGKLRITGTVFSANGIASLEASTDGARTFDKVSLARGKEPDKVSFAFDADTKKFPDGPRIVWLRSVDSMGLKGASAFLIFVCNTKPVVEVGWPAPGAVLHGRFYVAGSVRSAIGVSSLSYELEGGKKTDIQLTPGDPYFAVELDARQIKADKANIAITAQDRIGNITRYAISPKIDHQAEKPVVKVAWPAPEAKIGPGQLVWGSIKADDGGAGIRVVVDGGKPQEFPASDVFSFPVASDLSSGKHLLSIQAKDAYGTWGSAVSLPVTAIGGSPGVRFLRLASDKGSKAAARDYVPGMSFSTDGGSWLEGSLVSPSAPAKVFYFLAVAGGVQHKLELAKGNSGGSFAFRIPLDRSVPYGFVPIEVRGQDIYGQTFSGRALLYSTDLSSDREDTGFRFDDPRIGSDGRIALAPGDPLLGAFYREQIDSLRLDPPTDLVNLSFEGRVVRLESAGAGLTPPEQIVARTKNGHEFSSGPFIFDCGDSASSAGMAPKISSVNWAAGKGATPWTPGAVITLASGMSLTGTIRASTGIVSVEYRINDGPAQKASTGKPAGGDISFNCPLPSSLAYERFVVEVAVRDSAGLETKRRYDFHNVLPPRPGAPAADTANAIRFFDDRVTDVAGGQLVRLGPSDILVGLWNGRPLKTISVRPSTPLLEPSFDGGRITLTARGAGVMSPPTFRVHVETVDGDVSEWGPFGVVAGSAAPSVSMSLPENDAWTQGSVRIAGSAESSNGILSVEDSINGGAFIALTRASAPAAPTQAADHASFSFDSVVALEQVPDGAVRLDLRVRDASGAETIVSRFFNKDTIAPAVKQIRPLEGEDVTGPTTVIGEAGDAGHIASVRFLPSKDGAPQEARGNTVFSSTLDLARLRYPLPEGGGFLVVDRAGNSRLFVPKLQVNAERGKPVVEIQSPFETEVIRSDFSISGTAVDYAGVSKVYYRVDSSDWTSIEPKDAGFSIPVTLASTTDNEHVFEAYAENIYGIKGTTTSRKYRISKEEPRASMAAPDIAKPVRGIIDISGTASDANGIDSVSLSFDNGASYVKAIGGEKWHYPLDTRILKDGLHAVTIKPVDKYGTIGFSASLITVDNTPPEVQLAHPRDGAVESGSVEVSGRVSDNLKIASVRIELIPIGHDTPPVLAVDLGQSEVVRSRLDVSSLPPGPYTFRLVGRDRADNEVLVSRDIVLSQERPADKVELFYPVEGQSVSGRLRLYGRAVISGGASTATILSDGVDVGSSPLNAQGYFAFDMPVDRLGDGDHALSARSVGSDNRIIESRTATIAWKAEGPWLSVDSLALGLYLPARPWLSGKAGWAASAPDPKDAAAVAAYKKGESGRKVERVEVSLDNGRSYQRAGGGESWRFRLETQNYPEGAIFLLVRGTFRDGSVVVTKTMLYLDKTPPLVRILVPSENSRFSSHIRTAGIASDDQSGLASVDLALRKGDKSGYELPGFIQGLYLDGHFFGATTWEAGLGFSFFNDNVKLQAMFGQSPATDANGTPQRFFGNVYSAKLIANVLYLPFASMLGPDWDALSTSLGLGAEFSFFDMSGTTGGKVLSGVIAQLELPRYTLTHATFLKRFSLYVEEEAWLVFSDVPGASSVLFRTTVGARVGLF